MSDDFEIDLTCMRGFLGSRAQDQTSIKARVFGTCKPGKVRNKSGVQRAVHETYSNLITSETQSGCCA